LKNIPPGGYANKKGKGGVLGYVLAEVCGYFNRGRGYVLFNAGGYKNVMYTLIDLDY
jgi:hypothetical protein